MSTQSNINEVLKNQSQESMLTSLLTNAIPFAVMGMSYFGGEKMFISGLGLLVVNFILSRITGLFTWIKGLIHKVAFASIVLKSSDESYDWFMEWLAEQKFSRRSSIVSVHSSWGKGSGNSHMSYYAANPYKKNQSDSEKLRPNVYYIPATGIHFFFHKKRLIWISRMEETRQQQAHYYGRSNDNLFNLQTKETMIITTLGFPFNGKKYLRKIVDMCMENSFKKMENKTFIYTCMTGYPIRWKRGSSRAIRAMESVVFPKGFKEGIVEDLRTFLTSKKWYNKCGIPYRRGYIFYGPPGVGKTSLICALAGLFKMSIAVLTISSADMSDSKIQTLIDESPSNCFVVLEDVDSAVTASIRDQKKGNVPRLTFSGILNSLDGISSTEGRIVFMTTNYIERLPASLIRPGRVDMKCEFQYADKYQIIKMFEKFYPKKKKLSEKLSNLIPQSKVSPAELQEFFLIHRKKIESICENVDVFLKKVLNERNRAKEQEKEQQKKEEVEKGDIKQFIKLFSKIKGEKSPSVVALNPTKIFEKMNENHENLNKKNTNNLNAKKEDINGNLNGKKLEKSKLETLT